MLSPNTMYPIAKATKSLVFLKNFIKNSNIQIGDYTYYHAPSHPEKFETENVIFGHTSQLTIGKFCQLAYGTKFILSDANHQMNGFSTYPFFVFGKMGDGCSEWENYEINLSNKGDTFVGNDVWFGHEAAVMPAVNIGDGAIIAAKAVVTRNVPPYTIVGGNPAKPIRQRFSDEVIETLLKIQWWNWDFNKISRNISAIVGADIHVLLNAE